METRTAIVGNDWTVVTDKVAMLQFNDVMYMWLNDGDTPGDTVGFRMNKDEKYVNNKAGVVVWCKPILGATTIRSVRVAEDV